MAPAVAASLQPEFGPGSIAVLGQADRERLSRPEQPRQDAAATAAMSSHVSRAGT